MTDVEPMLPYRFLYPFGNDALTRLAYYFDYEYADGRQPADDAAGVLDGVRSWMAEGRRGALWLAHDGAAITVTDERVAGAARKLRLTGWQARAYDACDRVRSLAGLSRELDGVAEEPLRAFLDACVAARIMLRTGDRYLALAVTTPARSWRPADTRVEVAA